jgi:replication factor A1
MLTQTQAGTPTNPTASDPTTAAFEGLKKSLAGKLANELDEADLRDEFQKYLDYGVPVDQAVKTILRHHGVAAPPTLRPNPETQERVALAQLPPSSPSVHLKVRLLSLNTKAVMARGEQKEIVWGLLGDESGTAPYTSWRPLEGIAKGDVIDVQGAYTKEYNGQAQVNFGDRTRIAKLAAEDLPRTPESFKDTPIAELKEGSRGIRIHARLLDVASKEITVQGTPKTVWTGTLADASGKIEFTAWADLGLQADAAVTIEGGYVRAYRGVPQFNFDGDAKVTPYTGELPAAKELAKQPPMSLRDLVARGGGLDVHVVGSFLEVRPGSGLVLRCPTSGCTRVLQAGVCRIHNKVEGTPVPDLRVKGVLDDGTAAVYLTIGRELTEKLLGKNLEQAAKEAKDAFRPDLVQEQLRDRLTGRAYSVRGNALADEFGLSLIVRGIEPWHEDPKTTAAELLAQVQSRGGA